MMTGLRCREPYGKRRPQKRETTPATSLTIEERSAFFEKHEPLAQYWARRLYEPDSGEEIDDAIQVACLGLLYAIERFDPSRGFAFSTFATATILGVLRRHYRDQTPRIKVPRAVVERYQRVQKRIEVLQRVYAEANEPMPTPAQIAESMGETEEAVLEALDAGQARYVLSIEVAQPSPHGDSMPLMERIGQMDPAIEQFIHYADLRTALNVLTEDERRVITLRFCDHLSQQSVAHQMGISQMQVSRLQKRALDTLRRRLHDPLDGR